MNSRITQRTKALFLCALLLLALPAFSRSIPTINGDKAREAAREQVYWKGHACTLSTLAQDFLQSIYGQTTYKGLSAVQVVYGWSLRPDVWKDEPMILIPDGDLRRQLSIAGEYAKFSELFDSAQTYRLNTIGADLPERMRQIVRESQPVIELDEKVGMIVMLTQGRLIQPLPDSIPPLPAWRVEAEVLYNATPLWVLLLGAITLLGALVWAFTRPAGRAGLQA